MAEEQEQTEQQAAQRSDVEARGEQAQTSEALNAAVEQVDRAAQRARARAWLRPLRATLPKLASIGRAFARKPRLDVIDREGEIVVRAEVPGVPKERLDVAVTDDELLIRASKTQSEADGEYRRHEFGMGGFERRVSLPCEVQGDRASGSMQNGVLELVLPKSERSRRHSIEIR